MVGIEKPTPRSMPSPTVLRRLIGNKEYLKKGDRKNNRNWIYEWLEVVRWVYDYSGKLLHVFAINNGGSYHTPLIPTS